MEKGGDKASLSHDIIMKVSCYQLTNKKMEVSKEFLILVPVVVGVVQVIKTVGMPSKYAPLTSLILGVAGALFFIGGGVTGMNALQGVIVGLTASGLWSGVKATIA